MTTKTYYLQKKIRIAIIYFKDYCALSDKKANISAAIAVELQETLTISEINQLVKLLKQK